MKYRQDEEMQIRGVMKAYYGAFNRKNFDELQVLWLPDENAELILPGNNKVVINDDMILFYSLHFIFPQNLMGGLGGVFRY